MYLKPNLVSKTDFTSVLESTKCRYTDTYLFIVSSIKVIPGIFFSVKAVVRLASRVTWFCARHFDWNITHIRIKRTSWARRFGKFPDFVLHNKKEFFKAYACTTEENPFISNKTVDLTEKKYIVIKSHIWALHENIYVSIIPWTLGVVFSCQHIYFEWNEKKYLTPVKSKPDHFHRA